MDREELHRLIDTLPEAVLEQAKGILDHLQTWPPPPPLEIDRIRHQQRDRLRRYHEEGNAVRETHHFHEGIEITITERMRLGENGKALIYKNEIVGPGGQTHTQDITFQADTTET